MLMRNRETNGKNWESIRDYTTEGNARGESTTEFSPLEINFTPPDEVRPSCTNC